MDRTELAGFLRHCRERLQPGDVGLAAGARRRTSGLRREEVAQLAGMSVDYYIRLEQARGPHPSRQLLTALARALRLTDDERDYVFRLCDEAPPIGHSPSDHVRPAVLMLLDRLDDVPAFVGNDRYDLLAWNAMHAALMGDPSAVPPENRNISWLHFCDPSRGVRQPEEDRERISRTHVADLRATLAKRPDDAALRDLITRLRENSEEFARLWEGHDVKVRQADRKTILHPVVGRLDLDCEVLFTPEHDQRLVIFTAPVGSPTYEALRLLRVVGLQELSSSR